MSAQFILNKPPRKFRVGVEEWVEIKDCGRVSLSPQDSLEVDFAETGMRAFVSGRPWGYEISWSGKDGGEAIIAGRNADRLHILLVSASHDELCRQYRQREGMLIECALKDVTL